MRSSATAPLSLSLSLSLPLLVVALEAQGPEELVEVVLLQPALARCTARGPGMMPCRAGLAGEEDVSVKHLVGEMLFHAFPH